MDKGTMKGKKREINKTDNDIPIKRRHEGSRLSVADAD